MNRAEFLNKLYALYPKSFTEENKAMWLEGYKEALSGGVDFDKLYTTVLLENEKRTAPTPRWLHDKATYIVSQPTSVTFKNIWATSPRGYRYQFGYNPQKENFALVAESLIKQGFTNVSEEEYAANGV